MARTRPASAQVFLPVTVEKAWALLADTPRMVALDPLLDAYEPGNGVIEQGTFNRVTAQVGWFCVGLTTRTELIEPPHRAVFVSVDPARPIRVRAEDTLESAEAAAAIPSRPPRRRPCR